MADYAVSRFGRMLQEHWMWKQRPPLNASQAADVLGVSNSTMSRWLNTQALPPKEKIPEIHARTGLPLSDLYAACGYTMPPDIWEYIIANLRDDVSLLTATRQHVISRLEELRRHYELEIKHLVPDESIVFVPDPSPQPSSPSDVPPGHRQRRRKDSTP